jgi:hypothetical protein
MCVCVCVCECSLVAVVDTSVVVEAVLALVVVPRVVEGACVVCIV